MVLGVDTSISTHGRFVLLLQDVGEAVLMVLVVPSEEGCCGDRCCPQV